ncbi:MAG TPA: 4-hydroxy-tetrahydrodipicolinate reductase, partial [Paralcaligenes sp.]
MRIAIAGADGRMGRMLIEAVANSEDLNLTVALGRAGTPIIGQDAGAFLGKKTDVIVTDNLDTLAQADCLIDFTRPEGTLAHLSACVRHGTKCVIGTTGFSDSEKQIIHAASQKIAIVFAPNMSVGVNVALTLLDMAAKLLSSGYDVEIFEAHHRNKVD